MLFHLIRKQIETKETSMVDQIIVPQLVVKWHIQTRKRRRKRGRNTNKPMCASTRSFVLAALMMMMVSMTEIARTTWLSIPSLSFVHFAHAFGPQYHVPLRNKLSKSLCSFEATLVPESTSMMDEEDCAGDSKHQGIGTSAMHSDSNGNQLGVEVWDGVFSPEVCQELHELAIDHSERTTGEEDDEEFDEEIDDDSMDGSSTFVHRGHKRSGDERLTPIEQALDSFLTAYYEKHGMEDNREIVVEYWCRQEHLNLEAHADVDEVWFERSCQQRLAAKAKRNTAHNNSNFRYPAIGHVLYLTKPTLGVGPTCVFPPKEAAKTTNGQDSIRNEIDSVLTIPAVPGRVLRFSGNALHAVPKPADVWFSQHESIHASEVDDDNNDEEEDEEWDDDDDDDDEERSVILFNTWESSDDDKDSDIPVGPIGVPPDPMFHVDSDIDIVDMMMSSVDVDGGVEVDEEFVQGMVEYAKQQKYQLLKGWFEKYGEGESEDFQSVVYSKIHCQPTDLWKLASIDTRQEGIDGGDNGVIRVPLMGDKTRRRYPKKAIRWAIPSSFQKGVKEPERPCAFPLWD